MIVVIAMRLRRKSQVLRSQERILHEESRCSFRFFLFRFCCNLFFQLWNQSYPLAPVSKVIASNYIVPSSLGVTPAAHLQVLFCWPRRVGQRGEGVEGRAKGEGGREQGRGGRAGGEEGGRGGAKYARRKRTKCA